MGIHCCVRILATGSVETLGQIQQLIDDSTHAKHGSNWTYFGEIVGEEVCASVGRRWPDDQDDCVWLGECYPPTGFLVEMSVRFPEATFELRIYADDVDWTEVHEFKQGVERMICPCDPLDQSGESECDAPQSEVDRSDAEAKPR